jgi:CTP:molybdopterin cytidylyltransferase MocA
MGRCKALLPLGNYTFIETICSRLSAAGITERVVVLGAHADELRKSACMTEEKIVVNKDYRKGQLSSLQCGIRALTNTAAGALVTLVDHPLIATATYTVLKEAAAREPDKIITAVYAGRGGHPVVFPRLLFGELLEAPLDQGARWVVRRVPDRVARIDCDDPGIVADIDRPEDYARLVADGYDLR